MEEMLSLTEIGSIISGRDAARHDFSVARILATLSCIFVPPELMGHVANLSIGKQFLFHRGCPLILESILEAGLIAGRKDSREGRQTVFFTPVGPLVR